MSELWHDRLSTLAWFAARMDDVLSDMSVFHRIDDLDQVPAAVFFPRMVRLPLYDGAVRNALLRAEPDPAVPPSPRPAPQPQASPEPVRTHTGAELQALNTTREFGPMGVNQAGVFDFG